MQIRHRKWPAFGWAGALVLPSADTTASAAALAVGGAGPAFPSLLNPEVLLPPLPLLLGSSASICRCTQETRRYTSRCSAGCSSRMAGESSSSVAPSPPAGATPSSAGNAAVPVAAAAAAAAAAGPASSAGWAASPPLKRDAIQLACSRSYSYGCTGEVGWRHGAAARRD